MEKQTTATKIILRLIIFAFVVSIFSFASPTLAATSSMADLYANPNQYQYNANYNPYKFKVSDVVNSQVLRNVVGCTGIISKVSTWMSKLILSPKQTIKKAAETIKSFIARLKNACVATKGGSEMAGQAIPTMPGFAQPIATFMSSIAVKMPTISQGSMNGLGALGKVDTSAAGNIAAGRAASAGKTANDKTKICQDQVDATDPETLKELQKQTEQYEQAQLVEQCLNGIAITLAKNQLTAMTRSMMNWVNSGLGGNPYFVQNMRNFTTKLENNIIETGIDVLLAPGKENPYARDFARSTVATRGIVSSSAKFLGGLQSDLEAFVTDPKSYYTSADMKDAELTELALQRARGANQAFANDFATGGWNAWLAMTQRDNNNPLGFSMLANQYIAEMETQAVTEKKDELAQNNGFMSQKTCIKWQVYTVDGKVEYLPKSGGIQANGLAKSYVLNQKTVPPGAGWTCYKNGGSGDCCIDWKVTTPGSLIADKTKDYLTSDTRQLELAKTINDFLNGLFSALLSKLEGGGLVGLSDSTENISNWTDSLNDLRDTTSADGSTTYNNNGAYDGFNITRDLGNTYLHDTYTSLGSWNATTCPTGVANPPGCNITTSSANANAQALNPNSGPEIIKDANGVPKIPNINTYYTVTTSGTTKLIISGNNNWENGDRAFWDGTSWQNWKCGTSNAQGACTTQTNPIKKRGVLQIQEDYVVAAKEILKVLPGIMPKLGELDYCLPGPNPSYKTNSTNAETAYQDWLGSMYVGMSDSTGERFGVKIDDVGSRTYDDLHNVYVDNPKVWTPILDSMQFLLYAFSHICPGGESGGNNCGNYFYKKNGNLNFYDSEHLKWKQTLIDLNIDYATNSLFSNFYEVFDEMMSKLYFGNITQEHIGNEQTGVLTDNVDYVPMAQNGYDLTKDMLYYYNEIAQSTVDYTNSINQTMINIAKLKPIKDEVSQIITEAQDARNSRMLTQINLLNTQTSINCNTALNQCLLQHGIVRTGTTPVNLPPTSPGFVCVTQNAACLTNANTGLLTPASFNTKYASCIAEENIQVFDAEMLSGSETGNCSDSIDNDFDGLIDSFDPDCDGYVNPNGNNTTTTTTPPSYTGYFKLTADCGPGPTIINAWDGPFAMGGNGALPMIGYGDLMKSGAGFYYRVTGTIIDENPTDGTTSNVPNIYATDTTLTKIDVTLEPTRICPNGWTGGTTGTGTTTQTYTVTMNAIGSGGLVTPTTYTVTVTDPVAGGIAFFDIKVDSTPNGPYVPHFTNNCGAGTAITQPNAIDAPRRYQITGIKGNCSVDVAFVAPN
jgi:hypothetical protein